jgi:parallel beta-helix repeat protein
MFTLFRGSSSRFHGWTVTMILIMTVALGPSLALPGTAAAADEPCTGGVTVGLGQDIQQAINAHGAGTTYCLAAGRYQLNAPLRLKTGDVLWGAGPSPTSGTMLVGSRVMTGWVKSGSDWYVTGALPAPYVNDVGQCEDKVKNLCKLREDVFRGSTQLLRVATQAELTPGRFYADYQANRLYVRDDPAGATLQLSRTAAATVSNSGTDVTIRGLGIRYFASPSQSAALELGDGWQAISVDTSYNHALGFKINSATDGATFRAGRSSYNGQLGGGVNGGKNFRIEDVEVDHNNPQASYWVYDWESGGVKVTNGATGIVTRANVHHNLGIGLWADGQAGDAAVPQSLKFQDSTLVSNSADGIRFEISYNGLITGNTVEDNGCDLKGRRGPSNPAGLPDGAGIDIAGSANVEVSGNTVARNHNAIGAQERGGREVYLKKLRVQDNTIDSTRCANGFGLGLTGVTSLEAKDSPGWIRTFGTEGDNRFLRNRYTIPAADGGLTAKRYAWTTSYQRTWSDWHGTAIAQDPGGTATPGN